MMWEHQPPDLWLPKRFRWYHWCSFKLQGGDNQEGSPIPSEKTGCTVGISDCDVSCEKPQQQAPFLNLNPFSRLCGIENVAPVRVNQESCMALLDNGCQVNTVTPEFTEAHTLDVGLMSDLVKGRMSMVGLGGTHTHHLVYIIIRIQVDGVGVTMKIREPLSYQICLNLLQEYQWPWELQQSEGLSM